MFCARLASDLFFLHTDYQNMPQSLFAAEFELNLPGDSLYRGSGGIINTMYRVYLHASLITNIDCCHNLYDRESCGATLLIDSMRVPPSDTSKLIFK